jgi:molybdopterin converting factor small subunit
MPVKVIIPTPLRQYAEKKESMEVQAKTVAEALGAITSQYGDLRKHLYNDEGKLRSFVNIYVGDEDIRFLQKDQTPLKENDVISIVPSIAGGTAPSFCSGQALRCICSYPGFPSRQAGVANPGRIPRKSHQLSVISFQCKFSRMGSY